MRKTPACQGRYCTAAAVVFIIITVIITTVVGEKAKETQEPCLLLVYRETLVLTKVEPKTRVQSILTPPLTSWVIFANTLGSRSLHFLI